MKKAACVYRRPPIRPDHQGGEKPVLRCHLLFSSGFLNSSSCFCLHFFRSSCHVLGHVFASCQNQFHCLCLHFFRDFSECSHMLGRSFCCCSCEISCRLCVVGRLGFCGCDSCEFAQCVLCPFCGQLRRLVCSFQSNSGHFFSQSCLRLESFFHCFCINRECAHHVFENGGEIRCGCHGINPSGSVLEGGSNGLSSAP